MARRGGARLNNAVLRLLSEPAAHAWRQLEHLHGEGIRCPACHHGGARASGSHHVRVGPLIPHLDLYAWASP
jgi:hypothetical protein